MFAKVICIEGHDRSGKATQSKAVADSLTSKGYKVSKFEIPFNDGLTYWVIYKMLSSNKIKKSPNLFQFFQFLNKLFFQYTALLWAKLTSDYVILDRWKLSAIIYGNASGSNKIFNQILYLLLTSVDYTIVMSGETFKRDEALDAYESDNDFQIQVKNGYKNWVMNNSVDHALVTNKGTVEEVTKKIISHLNWVGITQNVDTSKFWWNSDTGEWEANQPNVEQK